MRRWTRRVALAGAAAAAAVVAATAAPAPRGFAGDDGGAKPDPFVVHEWGTFTSMQGSDGLTLEGLSREEEALPAFVYSRTKVRDCPLRAQGWKGLEVAPEHVTRKMETPVLYFRSRTPRHVRVRVDFVKGLISQWYPVTDLVGPPEGPCGTAPLDVSKVDRSFLEWDVDVLPRTADDAAPPEVPAVASDAPWQFAREVDANWLRTRPRTDPGRAGPVEAERYLFYRGLGAFPLPLDVSESPDADGTFVLRNRGDVAISWAILLQVEGDRGQIVEVGAISPRGVEETRFHGGAWWGPLDEVSQKLQAWMRDVLEKHGLTADEARAMVRTWSRSWFRCEGTRALWIVPRATTDAILPLSIDPRPDELVRVLVGRTEMIPRAVETEVATAVRDRWADDAAARAAATARLDRLGRFLEPHLRNVLAKTKDEGTRGNAERLLRDLAASGE